MILPEDTKAPLSDDEYEYDYDDVEMGYRDSLEYEYAYPPAYTPLPPKSERVERRIVVPGRYLLAALILIGFYAVSLFRRPHHREHAWRGEGSIVNCASGNTTFALPLASREIFASLAYAQVSDVTVESYASDSPHALVTVSSPGDAAARVCLLERNSTRLWPFNRRRAVGVGIYSPHEHEHNESLAEFSVRIALPLGRIEEKRSLVHALFALANPRPAYAVPPLSIRTGRSTLRVGNLTGVSLAALEAEAAVGDMFVEHVRAEKIRLKTVGNITADVDVSNALDVDTPAGAVNVTIGMARSPAYRFFHDPPPPTPPPSLRFTNSSDPQCAQPPIRIKITSNNPATTIQHSVYEVPCRQVSEHISSVGDVTVFPHELFQGPVHLSTSVGDIDVSVPEKLDPLGQGRYRRVEVQKDDGKAYEGVVRWYGEESNDEKEKESESEEITVDERSLFPRLSHGDRGHGPPGPPPPPPPGLTVQSSVGNVVVAF